MNTQARVSDADRAYFNGGIVSIATESSLLVSNSPYLNHAGLRALIAQEMLRRNGADLPNTAFIPEVAQILHELEDMPVILRLFEEEKARLPRFREWLDRRQLSDFSLDEVKACALGQAARFNGRLAIPQVVGNKRHGVFDREFLVREPGEFARTALDDF